jgi:hypothetical protein
LGVEQALGKRRRTKTKKYKEAVAGGDMKGSQCARRDKVE